MKLLILSDEHGENALLQQVLQREADAGAILFLGDGLRDIQRWQEANPGHRVYLARGNCDYGDPTPTEGVAVFGGVAFFYTHGHEYSVKMTLGPLAQAARRSDAQIALFGHTHCPLDLFEEGVRLFNPGSLAYSRMVDGPSYGVIEVENGEVLRCEHRRL